MACECGHLKALKVVIDMGRKHIICYYETHARLNDLNLIIFYGLALPNLMHHHSSPHTPTQIYLATPLLMVDQLEHKC